MTWEDVDGRTKVVSIDHQLIYKDLGDGYKFHISRQRQILESNYPYDIRCTKHLKNKTN